MVPKLKPWYPIKTLSVKRVKKIDTIVKIVKIWKSWSFCFLRNKYIKFKNKIGRGIHSKAWIFTIVSFADIDS